SIAVGTYFKLCILISSPKPGIILSHTASVASGVTSLIASQINIEQNKIIKLFTVATVAMMPPTLIGTIYGMNFK
ncbi:hypothetical protein FSE90_08725, partial [Campylobacter novaezeelandiae]|nr:hypothetical protein [Campylobacter novaezeelandiae]